MIINDRIVRRNDIHIDNGQNVRIHRIIRDHIQI